jgi:hypothetical protein
VKQQRPHYPQPVAHCEASDKKGYGSERAASLARKALKDKLGGERLHVYQCWSCHLWHLGNHEIKGGR